MYSPKPIPTPAAYFARPDPPQVSGIVTNILRKMDDLETRIVFARQQGGQWMVDGDVPLYRPSPLTASYRVPINPANDVYAVLGEYAIVAGGLIEAVGLAEGAGTVYVGPRLSPHLINEEERCGLLAMILWHPEWTPTACSSLVAAVVSSGPLSPSLAHWVLWLACSSSGVGATRCVQYLLHSGIDNDLTAEYGTIGPRMLLLGALPHLPADDVGKLTALITQRPWSRSDLEWIIEWFVANPASAYDTTRQYLHVEIIGLAVTRPAALLRPQNGNKKEDYASLVHKAMDYCATYPNRTALTKRLTEVLAVEARIR